MISIIIVPLGAMLFYKQYMIVGDTLKDSVVNMVAAVLGMIPEGLVLLTSVALTLGSMVLATKKTLVQELYCIETLARVDTLCLDKTGTITEGTMKVEDVQLYDTAQTTVVQHTAKFDPETGEPVQNVSALKPEVTVSAEKENGQIQETVNSETVSQEERQKLQEIDHIMGNMMSVLHDQNATADALRKRFPSRNDLKLIHAIPFSSDRKYSGAVFEGRGTYLMGAAQFLFPEGNEELLEHCSSYAQDCLGDRKESRTEKCQSLYRCNNNQNFGRNAACSCRVQCIRACNTTAEETDGTGSSVTEAYSCDDR